MHSAHPKVCSLERGKCTKDLEKTASVYSLSSPNLLYTCLFLMSTHSVVLSAFVTYLFLLDHKLPCKNNVQISVFFFKVFRFFFFCYIFYFSIFFLPLLFLFFFFLFSKISSFFNYLFFCIFFSGPHTNN